MGNNAAFNPADYSPVEAAPQAQSFNPSDYSPVETEGEKMVKEAFPDRQPGKPVFTTDESATSQLQTGAAQGVLGEKLGAQFSTSEGPQEKYLLDRIVNHPAYYTGFVGGRLAQLSGLTSLAETGLATIAPTAAEAFPILTNAAANSLSAGVSDYSDNADLDHAVKVGKFAGAFSVAAGLSSSAFSKAFPKSAASKELSGTSSIVNETLANDAEGLSHKEYLELVNKGMIPAGTPQLGFLSKAVQTGVDVATKGKFALGKMMLKQLGKNLSAEMTPAEVAQLVQDEAAKSGSEALRAFSKGMQATAENLGDRSMFAAHRALTDVLGSELGDSVGGLRVQQMADQASESLQSFTEEVLQSEKDYAPLLKSINNVQDYMNRTTGGALDTGYIGQALKSFRDSQLKNIDSELAGIPAYGQMASGNFSSGTGLEAAENIHSYVMDSIGKNRAAFREFMNTDLMQEMKALRGEILEKGSTSPIKDSDVLMRLNAAAERMFKMDPKNAKTMAESTLGLFKQIGAFPKNPEAAAKLAASKLSMIDELNKGNYVDALEIGDQALGITKRMIGFMAQGEQAVNSVAKTIAPWRAGEALAPNPASNLPAISGYHANRNNQASETGARSFDAQSQASPGENLTLPMGSRGGNRRGMSGASKRAGFGDQ